MLFDWDDNKNQQNIRKHGIDFELAKRIFEHRVITALDTREVYGEDREISIGMVDGILILTVVHTERSGGITRIISARKATRQERKRYEKALYTPFER